MRYAFFNPEGRVESAHNDATVTKAPQGAVELTEEQFADRFNLKLEGGRVLSAPVEVPAPTYEQLVAVVEAKRAAAYRLEADPLFFKSERGEATREEWQAKINEIKLRYPKP